MGMQQHLPGVDMERVARILAIKEAYNGGLITLEEGRTRLREQLGTVHPSEIAIAEQELQTFDQDECRKENIQQMLELFREVMDVSRPALAADHPIMCYYRENDAMRQHLRSIEDLVQYPVIRNQWYALYDELYKWRTHLARKQNQLYPVLEGKGFDRPTTTMWLLDDFVRDEIRDARRLLDEGKENEFIAMQATIVADVEDLMSKEESVLYPTSLAMITQKEFEDMKSGDREIGFAFIDVVHTDEPQVDSARLNNSDGFVGELTALLNKYGYATEPVNQLLDVTTGKLTLEQINLIYKHLPVDISFVDEKELVCFYSDTDHRVFPRSKNVIGRDVKNCHPRTSVHLVEEIIEKFRSGEQDSVDFWINKPDMFIYIYYVAVRDADGKFRGVLEMMQDCTRIRQLQDSRTLLTWSKDTSGASRKHGTESSGANADTPESESVVAESSPHQDPSASHDSAGDMLKITGETRVQDLLKIYPWMKDRLPEINSAFKMLKSPLARIIIPKATVAMMSERSGMPLHELIPALEKLINDHK